MSEHTHYWVHVASVDWRNRQVIVCKCACGKSLTPREIVLMRARSGLPS